MMEQNGNAIIIHTSLIIQQGLKNILLSRNIGISDMMIAVPDHSVLKDWKDLLLLIDINLINEFNKYTRVLRKNGNFILGIGISEASDELKSCFDDIIYIYNTSDLIIQKINFYISKVSDIKSDNHLSTREIEVLTMVAKGFSNKQIADQLFISIHTAIAHRKNITFKLGIKSISGLTLYAALNNMVDFH
jgi:DNA-binding CsgD family transcriptional regulator